MDCEDIVFWNTGVMKIEELKKVDSLLSPVFTKNKNWFQLGLFLRLIEEIDMLRMKVAAKA